MKKLLIVLFSIGLALGASAQKGGFRGGGSHFRGPRVIVGVGAGYSPFYPYYLSPFSPWYSPYGYGYRSARPSRLDLNIEDIKLDYADRIKSVKMDDSINRREKRHRIKELKYERDKAVIDAKKNYYYNRSGRPAPSDNNSNSNNNYSE